MVCSAARLGTDSIGLRAGDGLKNVGDAITPKGDISIGFVSIKTSGSTRDDGSRVSKEPGRTYHFNRGDAVAQGRLKAAPAGHAHTGYAEARGVKQKSAAEIADERGCGLPAHAHPHHGTARLS
jgi:hypothetical protein